MVTKGNKYIVDERPINRPLDSIEQIIHELEIDLIAEHFSVNSGTILYFYNLYGILPIRCDNPSDSFNTSKKSLTILNRVIKVNRIKNKIRHTQLNNG